MSKYLGTIQILIKVEGMYKPINWDCGSYSYNEAVKKQVRILFKIFPLQCLQYPDGRVRACVELKRKYLSIHTNLSVAYKEIIISKYYELTDKVICMIFILLGRWVAMREIQLDVQTVIMNH